MKRSAIASAVSIALANGLGAGVALAQDTDVEEQADEQQLIDEVITTGSRIRKDVFSSSTPLSVIDAGEASLQGIANVGELLQSNTAAAGSPQVTSAITTEFVTNGGIGSNTISLRGLGANLTLTLLNGRRAGPAGVRGGVSAFDLNVLPLAAIERVEILKDGASSIYGSDAVAGVVNIITKKDDGGTVEGYIGIPQESGGEETRFSASWGTSNERGRFRITADYHLNKELKYGDRDYLSCGEQYIFDPDTGQQVPTVFPGAINSISSNAIGGSGAVGGDAQAGTVLVTMIDSGVSIAPSATQAGIRAATPSESGRLTSPKWMPGRSASTSARASACTRTRSWRPAPPTPRFTCTAATKAAPMPGAG